MGKDARVWFYSGILVALMGASPAFAIRGLERSMLTFYNPEKDFSCLDGSGVISFDFVNDDYCDCADGSDEPGTSACSNGKFFCANVGHRAQYIPSSRVNDGICDCCDGSDEWVAGSCEDTCHALGAEARAQHEKMLKAAKEGFEVRKQLVEQAESMLRETLTNLQAKEQEVEQLRKDVELRRAEKEAAEAPEKEALDKYREEEERQRKEKEELEKKQSELEALSLFDQLDEDKDGKVTKTEVMTEIKFDTNNDGMVGDDEAEFYMAGNEHYEQENFLSTAWPLMKPTIKAPPKKHKKHHKHRDPDAPKAWNEAGQEVDEDGVPIEAEDDDDDLDEYDDYDDEEGEATDGAETVPPPPPVEEKKYDEATQALIDIADKARKSYDDANNGLRDLEREIKDMKDLTEGDYGEQNEFLTLKGQCFEFRDREYVYKMCPFDSCTQRGLSGGSETRLGNWERWDGPAHDTLSRMKFSSGQHCWNGPARSTVVKLICGVENVVESVTEPNRCEYQMVFATPAICKPPEHYQQQESVHDEL